MVALGRVAKIVGGSVASLYLVCVLLAVNAVGGKPAVADESVSSSSVASVAAPVERVDTSDEPVSDSVVEKAADVIPDWVEVMSALFLLAGAITAVTPTPKDNAVLIVVRKFFDILALNIGGAKNAAAERNKNTLS